MAVEIGRLVNVGIGREEAAVGTKSTQIVHTPVQEIAITNTREKILNDQSFGRIEDVRTSKTGTEFAEITLTGIAPALTLGQLFYAALGTLNTSVGSPEAGANTHDFTVLGTSNAHPSYTLLWKDGNQVKMILGARLNSLTIRATAGDWVVYEANFIGQPPVTTTETISYTDEELFCANQAVFKLAANVAGLGAASAIPLEDLSIDIGKNTENHFAFGSPAPANIINKQLMITGSMTLLFENQTYFDLFMADTLQAGQIALTHTEDIGATSTPFSFNITIPQLHISTHSIPRPLDEKISQTFEFKAEYNVSGGMVTAQVINDADNADY